MRPALAAALLCVLIVPLQVTADKAESRSEQWVKALRGSRSYRDGLAHIQRFTGGAYDTGAIAGAAHWENIHEYYLGLARKKGCEQGKPHADGPVKACHRLSGREPDIVGTEYEEGRRKVFRSARESMYPELVLKVLLVIYDYGYVQGMKHGLGVHNDDVRLKQSYYRACIARASGAEHEPVCATASKVWADDLLSRLRSRIEAHGLPAGAKPE